MKVKRDPPFRFAALSAICLALPSSSLATVGHFFAPDDLTGALYWSDNRCWFEGQPSSFDVVFRSLPFETTWVYSEGAGMGNLSILRGDWKFGYNQNAPFHVGGDLDIGDVAHPESVPNYTKALMTFDYTGESYFNSPGTSSLEGMIVDGTTYVGKSAGSDGTLNLIRSSNTATLTATTVNIGYGGDGKLNLTDGWLQYDHLEAGVLAGSTGQIVVDGEPAAVYHDFGSGILVNYSLQVHYPDYFHPTAYGTTDIGGGGAGSLLMKNGATGQLGWLTVGGIGAGSGTMTMQSNAWATAYRADIGYGGGGTGELNLDHGSLEVILNPYHPHVFPGEGNLTINGYNGAAAVHLDHGANLSVAETLLIRDDATLTANNQSVVKVEGGTYNKIFQIKAAPFKTASATFDDSKLDVSTGSIWVGSGVDAAVPEPYGSAILTARNGSELKAANLVALGGDVALEGAGTKLTVSNAALVGDADGYYGGSLSLSAAATASFGSMLKTGDLGTVSVLGGGSINVGDGGPAPMGHIVVGPNGVLGGRGTYFGEVDVNGGTVDPGFSPGTMHVVGNYTMNGGTLLIQIGGFTPGAEYDQLDVSGMLAINSGTIEFELYNGWVPPVGATFDFFHAGGLSIAPGVTFLNNTGGGFVFDPTTGKGTVTPVPEPAGLLALAVGALGLVSQRRRK